MAKSWMVRAERNGRLFDAFNEKSVVASANRIQPQENHPLTFSVQIFLFYFKFFGEVVRVCTGQSRSTPFLPGHGVSLVG
ncbi:hypothetical protein [Rhizobium sp. SRDI969]|uniref:hypothetical protein n=1 Tax=Rhizobium sp. SRDI969 TaxID=3138252 RepID=UPI0021A46A26|nr:hypothetical protein [Rhizobium leguminosarum]UWM82136.1 hypothetical protein N2A41_02340 [Rhizobium leguminosarum bv. viciae]